MGIQLLKLKTSGIHDYTTGPVIAVPSETSNGMMRKSDFSMEFSVQSIVWVGFSQRFGQGSNKVLGKGSGQVLGKGLD